MKRIVTIVTLFNFAAAGIGFFTTILLARWFSYEIFGRINLLLSLSAILITFLQFGFQNSLVIFSNKQDGRFDVARLFFVNREYLKYLLIIGFPFLLLFIYFSNKTYLYSIEEIFFLLVSPIFLVIYNYVATFYQAAGIWLKYNVLNLLYSLLKAIIILLTFFIIYVIRKESYTYNDYIYSFLAYSLILFAIGWLTSIKYIHFGHPNKELKGQLYKTLIPIGISNLLIIIIMRVDNIIIEHFLGVKDVAIYSAANSIAFAFPLITSSIMKVLMKEVSKNSLLYLEKILFYQKKYFIHLIVTILLTFLIAPYLIPLLLGERYTSSVIIFQLLSIVYIGGIFFTPLESFFYTEDPYKILLIKVLQIFIVVIFGIIFIYFFSLVGMSIAIILSRVVAWIYLYIKSQILINR